MRNSLSYVCSPRFLWRESVKEKLAIVSLSHVLIITCSRICLHWGDCQVGESRMRLWARIPAPDNIFSKMYGWVERQNINEMVNFEILHFKIREKFLLINSNRMICRNETGFKVVFLFYFPNFLAHFFRSVGNSHSAKTHILKNSLQQRRRLNDRLRSK